ncbi:hypothetical protein Tco_0767381 [Tanacetum coccineum]
MIEESIEEEGDNRRIKDCALSKDLSSYLKWVDKEFGVPYHLQERSYDKGFVGLELYWIRAKEVPGWTPDLVEDSDEEELSDDDSLEEGMKNLESENDSSNSFEVPDTVFKNEGDKKSVNDFKEKAHNEDDGDSNIPTSKKIPILLRESAHDYGPVPFRFFHHWIHLEGFNDFVTSTWNSAPSVDSNGMRNLAGTEVEAEKRMEVLAALRNIDHIHSMDLAQKAKIKWSIEGDENSKFFHGILNKKRNQMNIRGITIDGVWKEQPNDVKQEFLSHFQDRFAKTLRRGRANIE